MSEQTFKFVSEYKGVGKNNGKPFHTIEVHDPKSFQNLTFFADTTKIQSEFGFAVGEDVKVTGVSFQSAFKNTTTLITGMKSLALAK